ncbi:MAG: DNA-binding domain-containing protein [Pseudomonadota bacterium]
MPTLPELQRDFARDLLDDQAGALNNCISSGKFSPERLLQVYRNNYFISLTRALGDIHPTVEKLVGEGFFNYLADQYIREHPSREGNLHNFGEHLPAFISEFEAAASLPYLADVARVDAACHRIFHAADATPIAVDRLAGLDADSYASLTLSLSPALAWIASEFPVYAIWRFAGEQDETTEPPDLNAGCECVLVQRPAIEVEVAPISHAELVFISALSSEQILADAVTEAVNIDAQFDLNAALGRLLQNGLIVDIHLPDT